MSRISKRIILSSLLSIFSIVATAGPGFYWEYVYSWGGYLDGRYFGLHGEDFEFDYYNYENKTCEVVFVNPNIGPHVEIPETHDGFTVIGVKNPGFLWCKGAISVKIPKTIRSLEFKKYYSMEECNYHFEVDPQNPYFSSLDGSLYINHDGRKYGWLAHQPYFDVNFSPLPETIGMGNYDNFIDGVKVSFEGLTTAISKDKFDSSYTLPASIEYFSKESFRIDGVEHLTINSIAEFEGEALNLPYLTTLSMDAEYRHLPKQLMYYSPKLVKVFLPESLTSIGDYAFYGISYWINDYSKERQNEGVMFFNLPNVESIGECALGSPQAIKLGHGSEGTNNIKLGRLWHSAKQEKTLHVCFNSTEVLERPEGSILASPQKQWILYVPEEVVKAYKDDAYWGTRYNVEPIRDMLIPLVSEPELTLEMGDTHKYLWDVMPLGNAVPEETGVWSSLNPKVAIVDQNGRLTAYTAGKTDIVFTLKDTDGNEYTAVSKVTVNYPAGVDDVRADEDPEVDNQVNIQSIPDGVYNMHGQRVADSTEGLTSGLYIVRANGKTTKTIIR